MIRRIGEIDGGQFRELFIEVSKRCPDVARGLAEIAIGLGEPGAEIANRVAEIVGKCGAEHRAFVRQLDDEL